MPKLSPHRLSMRHPGNISDLDANPLSGEPEAHRCRGAKRRRRHSPPGVKRRGAFGPAWQSHHRRAGAALVAYSELRIGRAVEEAFSSDVAAPRRHVRQWTALGGALKRQFELHAGGIEDEELPERRSGHQKLAPLQPEFAKALHEGAEPAACELDVVDRSRAIGRRSGRRKRRAARMDVDDRRTSGQRHPEPRSRVTEVGTENFAKADLLACRTRQFPPGRSS